MPLVPDFGEMLDHPLQVLRPQTQLVLTRDYRIFEQFSNFPDAEEGVRPHIEVSALPSELRIAVVHEEAEIGTQYTREDETGHEMGVVSAAQLQSLIMPDDTSPTNKAIKAYIDQLPGDTPIITSWL